ncbi:immunity 52 family protein [Burkholderia gladioli]|uniref:immunity 52 family protein n=1 Tax=Burkholderia gladioli TaxID=28095 RepID=UPI001641CF95|nr:immunity 52 family protein [Burkholderia gladioli]
MEINAQFRETGLSPTQFAIVLCRLGKLVDVIAARQPGLQKDRWRLKGDSREAAELYPAFEGDNPSLAAVAVLTEEFRNADDQTFLAIWNGDVSSLVGASITCHVGPPGELNMLIVRIDWREESTHGDGDMFIEAISCVVEEFNPAYVEVSPAEYFEKRVFDDKPGVGWMLYLPHRITTQQVPEARALIPIPSAGRKQTGTIIVSVVDEAFSADNPEHVEIANRMEIRLVDHDLLPTYLSL